MNEPKKPDPKPDLSQPWSTQAGPIPLDNWGNDIEHTGKVDPNDPMLVHMAKRMEKLLAEKKKP